MSRHPIIAAIAIALLAAAACAGGAATTAPASVASAAAGACAPSGTAGTVSVKIANFAFDPSTVTATVGDTVTWTNNDTAPHTATVSGESCATPTLAAGASGSITFTRPGTYAYFCSVHPRMRGKVEVAG